jgi:hypothetical protein
MTFVLHAFLGPDSPGTSNDLLAADLRTLFADEEEFRLTWEHLPFAKAPTLALRWGNWLARVAYEQGERVTQDGAYAHEVVGESAPFDLSGATSRVRVVFASDDDRAHTNQIVSLMHFLQQLPGAAVFDPQQGDILT